LRIFANLCESLRIFANLCESLRIFAFLCEPARPPAVPQRPWSCPLLDCSIAELWNSCPPPPGLPGRGRRAGLSDVQIQNANAANHNEFARIKEEETATSWRDRTYGFWLRSQWFPMVPNGIEWCSTVANGCEWYRLGSDAVRPEYRKTACGELRRAVRPEDRSQPAASPASGRMGRWTGAARANLGPRHRSTQEIHANVVRHYRVFRRFFHERLLLA